jgi:hypothetical protein
MGSTAYYMGVATPAGRAEIDARAKEVVGAIDKEDWGAAHSKREVRSQWFR